MKYISIFQECNSDGSEEMEKMSLDEGASVWSLCPA